MHLHFHFECAVILQIFHILISKPAYAIYATTELSSLTSEILPALQGTANHSDFPELTRRLNESPQDHPTRPVWLYFTTPDLNPPSTHPKISASIGIAAGDVQGSSVGTLIELDLLPRDPLSNSSNDDSDSSEASTSQNVYQVVYGQYREPIQGASDAEPVPVAEYTHNHMLITRYYLGVTTVTDSQILDPDSGAGAIMDAVREYHTITSMSTRSEFIQEVLNYLYVHYSEQYYAELHNDVSAMFDLITSNDVWNIQHGITPHDEIFPTHRIPFILNVKGDRPTQIQERKAYVMLDIGAVDAPGLSWSIGVTPPDRDIYWRVLDYFLWYPDWNGLTGLDDVVRVPGFYQA